MGWPRRCGATATVAGSAQPESSRPSGVFIGNQEPRAVVLEVRATSKAQRLDPLGLRIFFRQIESDIQFGGELFEGHVLVRDTRAVTIRACHSITSASGIAP